VARVSTARHHAADRHASFLADFLGNCAIGVPDLSAYASKMRVPLLRAKGDGDGANWRLCAESLFRVAFDALDRLPDDQKKALAGRVHAGAYDRLSGNPESDFAPSKTGPGEGGQSPSNTFDLKSSPDGPGK
jgi:hypothetical protein